MKRIIIAFALVLSPLGFGLTQEQREEMSVSSLLLMEQEELDQLYGEITPGTLPDGFYLGDVVIHDRKKAESRLLSLKQGDRAWSRRVKEVTLGIWKGKDFEGDILFNKIGNIRRFPAAVYCGKSKVDGNSAIVLDYRSSQNLEVFKPAIDWIVTDKGLQIRDEIRMIKPGLYLGRAYARGKFILNFVLHQDKAMEEGTWEQSCVEDQEKEQ